MYSLHVLYKSALNRIYKVCGFHIKMKFSDEIMWLKLTWMEQLLCKMRFSQIKYNVPRYLLQTHTQSR